MELRPYQQEAVQSILASLEMSDTALCVLPTGAGKTVVFSDIIRQMQVKTLVLAHRKELLEQARDKIIAAWPGADIGLVGYGQSRYGEHITIASVASLCSPKRRAQLAQEGIKQLVIDECHHAMAESYRGVLETVPDAKIMGFTATAERLDKKDIRELFGEPVYERSIVEMIQDGYLTDIRTYAILCKTTSLDDVSITGGDYQAGRLASAIDRPDRNEIIVDAYKEHADGLSTIVFAATVEHAEHLALDFCEAGIAAYALSGETPAAEREEVLSWYRSGDVKVLTNVQLLTEGFDAPRTSCVIMARPTKSLGLYKQCLGRGLRLYTDPETGDQKTECIFIDITDNCRNHRLQPRRVHEALDGMPTRNGLTLAEVQKALAEERKRVEEARRLAEEAAAERELMQLEQELELQSRKEQVKQQTLTHMDEVLARQIDILGLGMEWESPSENSYRLIVGQDTLHMEHFGNSTYQVYIEYFNQIGLIPLLKRPIPFEHAQNLCAKYAQQILDGKGYALNPHARWKQEPATEKQLQTLAKCRIATPDNCTKGDAGLLLDLYWSHPSRVARKVDSKAS